jgi:hypothetical protein
MLLMEMKSSNRLRLQMIIPAIVIFNYDSLQSYQF